MNLLERIQRLQFHDRSAAEDMLQSFVRDVFSYDVVSVELRPLAVSLNSFNGFITLSDKRRLFFKSHVEPGSVIAEYYNSDLLQQAGYAVIKPVAASTEPGKQMLLYEVVEDESVFDVTWRIEREGDRGDELDRLTRAQVTCDEALLNVYQDSLHWVEANEHAAAPVHQLFYHRLTGGRLDAFYGQGIQMTLPNTERLDMQSVRRKRWQINGKLFADTLDDVIDRATNLLKPAQAGPAIVGHGDAHNGNVFLRTDGLVYFDPAFAGRHDPLLDLVKPLYHNVHAMWMYFPSVLVEERGASLLVEDDTWIVQYPEALHPVRGMFWESKTQNVLIPLLKRLRDQGWLRDDWRAYLQAGLACCPLLTMNLTDSLRFPPSIALLGLAHVIEMAGSAHEGSRIEAWLDQVEAAL